MSLPYHNGKYRRMNSRWLPGQFVSTIQYNTIQYDKALVGDLDSYTQIFKNRAKFAQRRNRAAAQREIQKKKISFLN